MRVLHISIDTAMGGIETFLLNVYRLIDKEKVQFDFIEYGEEEREFDYKYKELGAKIYKLPDRKKHPLKAKKELSKILEENDYQVVHLHKNSLSDIGAIRVCEKMKVPTIVVHSHNSSRDNKIIVFLHRINRKLLKFDDIIKFSCSDTAANWLFGDTKDVQYVKNGIDTSKFDYNLEVRKRIREKIKVKDCVVLGSLGRVTEQKNPLFLLDIVKDLNIPNVKLLIVGDGELLEDVKTKTKEYGIKDKVIFTGAVSNPEDYYQAMDIYLMPSYYEGFPISAIEAQCADLPVILSKRITSEADITDKVYWADIVSTHEWCLNIKKIIESKQERNSNKTMLVEKGFDMQSTVEQLQNFYLNREQKYE